MPGRGLQCCHQDGDALQHISDFLVLDKHALVCRTSSQGISNVLGALLVAAIFLGTNNASTVQPVVDTERTVFFRERSAGCYAPYPFALAQAVVEIPYLLVQTIMYSCIT